MSDIKIPIGGRGSAKIPKAPVGGWLFKRSILNRCILSALSKKT